MKKDDLTECHGCGMLRHDDEWAMSRINEHEKDAFCYGVACGDVGSWAWCERCEVVDKVSELYGNTEHNPGEFYCGDCLNDELAERRARLYAL